MTGRKEQYRKNTYISKLMEPMKSAGRYRIKCEETIDEIENLMPKIGDKSPEGGSKQAFKE